MTKEKKILTTKFIVRAGIFSALAIVLYLISKLFPPMFGGFLKVHIDEVPMFIASFSYGPLLGFVVITVKTLISLIWSDTACIGELADFIYSLVFILPAAFIYKKRRNFKSVIIGFSVGFILQIIVSFFVNVYVMVPLLTHGNAPDNPLISIGVSASLPFNVIKNLIVIFITLPTYKILHKLIDKIDIK